NIGNQCGKRWKGIGSRYARSQKAQGGSPEPCTWRRRSPMADDGDARGISPMPNGWWAAGVPGIDAELCTRCRAASMADGNAQEVPVEARSHPPAEPIRVSSGRGTYQVVQPRLRSA